METYKDFQGSDGEDFRPKYRFNDENKSHQHLLWSERKQQWEQLTGTTTILDVLGKVLTWWASGLAVSKLGWTNSKIKVNGKYEAVPLEQRLTHLNSIREAQSKLDDTEYLSLLDEAYKAHSVRLDETADAGTDLHTELERFVKEAMNPTELFETRFERFDARIHPFMKWSDENVKRFIWSEGYCYDEILFVGGITDCGAELKDGSFVIIDFKSAKEAYFNHFVQIAIYNLLIEKNGLFDKDGNQILKLEKGFDKYIVVPFGASKFTIVENNNINNLKKAGLACVELYRAKSLFEGK